MQDGALPSSNKKLQPAGLSALLLFEGSIPLFYFFLWYGELSDFFISR
jgi:hypothetical protein